MKKVSVFFSYGQGGAPVDYGLSGNGTGVLLDKIKKLGVSGSAHPWSWTDSNAIAKAIRALPPDVLVIVGGTSLGANEAPRIGGSVGGRTIDLMVGIQPSVWSPTKSPVTANVKLAMFFRNPFWPMTFGLGSYRWVRAEGNHVTTLIEQQTDAPHPGDNIPWIHDAILAEVKKLLT